MVDVSSTNLRIPYIYMYTFYIFIFVTAKHYTPINTHIMDEFSFQEANRFQGEQVVKQEGVGIFESADNTSIYKGTQMDLSMGTVP